MGLSRHRNNEAPMGATIEASNLSVSTKELTMNSIATQISTINVPFHGDNLYLVNFNGEPHVPMKPVVEGMGLAWQPQHEKLKTRFNKGITEIVIPTKGGEQSMTCLAFRKFAGWLHTINVGKVRPELREKVARYQDECDDVLYQYWTKGEVKNQRKKTTVDERTPLRDAVNMLVGKKGLRYDDAYTMVHQRFNIDSIDELELEQIPLAVEYIHRVVLEGEFLGKQEALPAPKMDINFPISWFVENAPYTVIRQQCGDTIALDRSALVDCSPAYKLIAALTDAGYDVSAVSAELKALRTIMAEQGWALKEIASYTAVRDKACHRISI
ncbi:phage antirepressor N-terminal domain-containing protein [Citrobacter freundii]